MEFITFTAKTLDDAITNAQVQLGVASEMLEYEVIEKGSEGFLGIGRKQAVIKARRKPEKVEEPVVEKVETPVEEAPKAEEKDASAQKPEKEIKKAEKAERKEEKKEFKSKDKSYKKDRNHKKEKFVKEVKPVVEKEEKKEVVLSPVEEETIAACKKFIEDVLAAMGMTEVNVIAKVDEEGALCIDMDGKNMGILIGKRGQTLDSLQYLANRVANKMQTGYVRVKLDTENYRSKRKKTLEHLAKNISGKVKRTRRAVALEPMNPYERRIIHSALQGDPAVSTHSEGEEPYRKVVVTLNRR